jgi:hypothetical protein
LKQVVQIKDSEAFSTLNLGLCQNIVDDANHSLSISIHGLQGVEIKVSNL